MKALRIFLPYLIILLFSFFAFKPLLNTGFFPIHDDTQVVRTYEMTSAIKDGMFPVRWVKDLGYSYGYPIFNYYDPFPYYLSGFIGLFTDSLLATKLAIIIAILGAGLSMYLFAKEFWGEAGGVLSAILYVYAPYHGLDLYVRGDLAELFAYAFIPLLFFGVLKTARERKWLYVIVASVSYAFTITSHNLTALIVSPFIFLFAVLLLRGNKKLKASSVYIFGSLLLGIMLSAFYWLPALLEINYTNVFSQITGGSNYADNFVCLSQLWVSPWGYGGSVKGCIDGLSFMVGKYHLILATVSFIVSLIFILNKKLIKNKNTANNKFIAVVIGLIALLVSLFFTLDASKFFWDIIKPFAFIQYPWRFLLLSAFFVSFVSGFILWVVSERSKNKRLFYIFTATVLVVIVFVNMKFFIPQSILNKTSDDYTNKYSVTWITSKVSDEYMPNNFLKPKNASEIPDITNLVSGDLSVKILSRKTQKLDVSLSVKKEGNYILPVAFFPAWVARIDGKKVNLTQHQRGIVLYFPKGNHNLTIEFKQTPVEKASNAISLAGIAILIAGIILPRPKYAKS